VSIFSKLYFMAGVLLSEQFIVLALLPKFGKVVAQVKLLGF
jgi:hypothetical protein